MKNCPQCNMPVDGLRCSSCGYTEPGARVEPLNRSCADVTRGQRCANTASFSHSTNGSGPWLCWDHFAPNATRYKDGVKVGPPGGFQALRDQLRKAAPTKPDYELEAERAAIRNDQAP
jgi:hypothetical protein